MIHKGRKISDIKDENRTTQKTTAVALVTTVAEKMAKYSTREVKNAEQVRRYYVMFGRQSENDFKNAVTNYRIKNMPPFLTKDNIKIANDIWGIEFGHIAGKSKRRTPSRVEIDIVQVPPDILTTHGNLVLSVDIMFVCTIPFLITICRGIKFGTANRLQNRKRPPY